MSTSAAPGVILRELLLKHDSEAVVNECKLFLSRDSQAPFPGFRFMMLKKFANDSDHSAVFAPPKIDKLWQIALDSPQYAAFCAAHVGVTVGRVARSCDDDKPTSSGSCDEGLSDAYVTQCFADRTVVEAMQQNTLVAYRVVFKSDAPSEIWGRCFTSTPAIKAPWVQKLHGFGECKLTVKVNKLNHPQASAAIEVTHATTSAEFRAQVETALGVTAASQIYLVDVRDTIGRSRISNDDELSMYTIAPTGKRLTQSRFVAPVIAYCEQVLAPLRFS
jgi:hypothetical protein